VEKGGLDNASDLDEITDAESETELYMISAARWG